MPDRLLLDLCAEAKNETNPQRLLHLLNEINNLLATIENEVHQVLQRLELPFIQ
jgi:hypothetical protein